MTSAELIEHTLELAVERIGDPAPRVYERLFARFPELEALFVNDRSGAVRAEMFLKTLDLIRDLLGDSHYATGLLATEWTNHRNLGVPMERFGLFFETLVDTLREALGPDWTPPIDAAWNGVLARLRAVVDAAAASAAH